MNEDFLEHAENETPFLADIQMPTAAVGLADRGSLVPSPISPTETIAYSEGTENGDLCFAENETPFLADIQMPTAAKGLGDQGSLVPSPISPSETIAYSEGGSPLRLEESDLEELVRYLHLLLSSLPVNSL